MEQYSRQHFQTKEIVIGTWEQVSSLDRRLWSDPEVTEATFHQRLGQSTRPPISKLTSVLPVPQCVPLGKFCEVRGCYTLSPISVG